MGGVRPQGSHSHQARYHCVCAHFEVPGLVDLIMASLPFLGIVTALMAVSTS